MVDEVALFDGGSAQHMGEGFWLLMQNGVAADGGDGSIESIGVHERELRALVDDPEAEPVEIENGAVERMAPGIFELSQRDEYNRPQCVVITAENVAAMLEAVPLAA